MKCGADVEIEIEPRVRESAAPVGGSASCAAAGGGVSVETCDLAHLLIKCRPSSD